MTNVEDLFIICLRSLNKLVEAALNLIFPPRCLFCNELLEFSQPDKKYLCNGCCEKISFIGSKACALCGKKNQGEGVCSSCRTREEKKYYSKVLSACEYDGIVREKLIELKFEGRKELAGIFADLIIRKMQMTNGLAFDIIISVPMFESEKKKRGYNQSALIARQVAFFYKINSEENNLIKIKLTQAQSSLDRKNRISNIKDVFEVKNPEALRDMNILLIDDIFTTGSTANECSKMLLAAGARKVIVATVATGKMQ